MSMEEECEAYKKYQPTRFCEGRAPVAGQKVPKAFPFDSRIIAILRAEGRGAPTWHYQNVSVCQVNEVGPNTYQVGNGTKPLIIHKNRLPRTEATWEQFSKARARLSRAWTDGKIDKLPDPQSHTLKELRGLSGSWVNADDLRLRSREIEILGMIAANPAQLSRSTLASIYNTNRANIDLMFRLMASAGVAIFTNNASRVRVADWGVYDKETVLALFHRTKGLEEVVSHVRFVHGADFYGKGSKAEKKTAQQRLAELWERVEKEKQQQGE